MAPWPRWIVFRSAARPVQSAPLRAPTGGARASSAKYHRQTRPSWCVGLTRVAPWIEGICPDDMHVRDVTYSTSHSTGERRQKQVSDICPPRPHPSFPRITLEVCYACTVTRAPRHHRRGTSSASSRSWPRRLRHTPLGDRSANRYAHITHRMGTQKVSVMIRSHSRARSARVKTYRQGQVLPPRIPRPSLFPLQSRTELQFNLARPNCRTMLLTPFGEGGSLFGVRPLPGTASAHHKGGARAL